MSTMAPFRVFVNVNCLLVYSLFLKKPGTRLTQNWVSCNCVQSVSECELPDGVQPVWEAADQIQVKPT